MLSGRMCAGIIGDTLMARAGPIRYAEALPPEQACMVNPRAERQRRQSGGLEHGISVCRAWFMDNDSVWEGDETQ